MIRLGVNLDHIATVRQARGETYPDPIQAVLLAELGGADNITFHLREDRRHIQDRDVYLFKEVTKIPLNFEIAVTKEMIDIACKIKPHSVTLVPEKRQELTTEGGLNVFENMSGLRDSIKKLKQESGCLVSLFVEAEHAVVEATKDLGADAIEIHTGNFCHQMDQAKNTADQFALVKPFNDVSNLAHSIGLQVHFGHGLHYNNAFWLQHVTHCEEANIGHSIISRALFVGLPQAVREMKELLNNPNFKPKGSL